MAGSGEHESRDGRRGLGALEVDAGHFSPQAAGLPGDPARRRASRLAGIVGFSLAVFESGRSLSHGRRLGFQPIHKARESVSGTSFKRPDSGLWRTSRQPVTTHSELDRARSRKPLFISRKHAHSLGPPRLAPGQSVAEPTGAVNRRIVSPSATGDPVPPPRDFPSCFAAVLGLYKILSNCWQFQGRFCEWLCRGRWTAFSKLVHLVM